jgi:hypothetical protein
MDIPHDGDALHPGFCGAGGEARTAPDPCVHPVAGYLVRVKTASYPVAGYLVRVKTASYPPPGQSRRAVMVRLSSLNRPLNAAGEPTYPPRIVTPPAKDSVTTNRYGSTIPRKTPVVKISCPSGERVPGGTARRRGDRSRSRAP